VAEYCVFITTPNEGFLRKLFKSIAKSQLKTIDSKVDHIQIVPMVELYERLSQPGWKPVYFRSFHIVQPFTDKFLPSIFEKLVYTLERVADVITPYFGTVSVVLLNRKPETSQRESHS
jgi:hypothetical protein